MSANFVSFPACSSALGMENGEIPDFRITASSVYVNGAIYKPWIGRLNNPNGAWVPQIYRPDNWLKIDLSRKMIVTKVATQGKPNLAQWQWVTSYKISFSQDDHAWEVYKEHGIEKVNGILYPEYSTYCVSLQHKCCLGIMFLWLDNMLSSSLFLIVLFFLVISRFLKI